MGARQQRQRAHERGKCSEQGNDKAKKALPSGDEHHPTSKDRALRKLDRGKVVYSNREKEAQSIRTRGGRLMVRVAPANSAQV